MDAKHTLGEPRVLISRDALLHNVAVIRRHLKPETRLCAILKADAYGHGADLVLDALCNFARDPDSPPAVDAVAVASIDEAILLPSCGLPVIVFRPVENCFVGRQRQKLEIAIRNDWVLTVCTRTAARDLARIAMAAGMRASVQVMVDTGMARSGVSTAELPELLNAINALPSLKLAGACTHLACSEEPDDALTLAQVERFGSATEAPYAAAGGKLLRHAANSGGVFFHPRSHYDMVRPGISLYGIDPTCRPCADRPLRPAMKWTAPLVAIQSLRRGDGVGYGQTWLAPRHSRIGLVAIGYADGYLRCFGNRASMVLHGRPVPVIGRVSMDLTTIDLTDLPQARLGDEVTVLDDDPLSPASAYRLAELAGTIPYEIFCRIGTRMHRVPVQPDDEPERDEPKRSLADPEPV